MPRIGWIAAGAICAALVTHHLTTATGAAGTVLALAAAVVVAAVGVRRDIRVAAAGVAAALVLARAAAGIALAPVDLDPTPRGEPPAGWQHNAVVVSVNAPSAGSQRAVLELRSPEDNDRVFATLPRFPQISVGDVVTFGGLLEAAPDDGGFGAYLARSGIAYTTRARELGRIGTDGSTVAALEHARRWAAQMIAIGLPQPEAGLAGAMSIGLRDLVSREVTADFRVSGLSHVVAISGWHIAMLGAVVSGMLATIGRRPRSLIVLLAIAAYALFAGASPGILRAAVMASVVLLARESGRRGSAGAALALTVATLIVADPATISDIGFQLSAAATAGLLGLGGRASAWLGARLPRRTPAWLVEAVAVSAAAQAATLPLVLFHFGSLSLVAPLANLLVAPIVAPAMLVTALAFVTGVAVSAGVPAILLAPLAISGSLLIGAMIAIARLCAALPFATVAVGEPVNMIAAIAAAGGLLALIRRGRDKPKRPAGVVATPRADAHTDVGTWHPGRRRRLAGAGAALATVVLLAGAHDARSDGRLHVTVLDIGQGDSILLEGPSGGRALIDGGPDPDRLIALLDARIPLWDRRLDLVVLTHPHEDHVAGLAAVLDRYRVTEIVEPGMVGPGPGDAAYRRRLTDLGRQSRVVAAGDKLALDGAVMNVRWPPRGGVPLRPPDTGTGINNVSIVLDIRFGARRLVLTGDVEEEIDPQLLAAGLADDGKPIDVLKVAHHGSRTATTDAFLEQTQPGVAVISAGSSNPYGHPSPETVARLVAGGAKVYRTDRDGSVDVSTNGTDLLVSASGGRPAPSRPPRPTAPAVGFCPINAAASGRRRTYNRRDVDPIATRSGAHPTRPGSARMAGHAQRGGRGRRGAPGQRHREAGPHDRRRARGGGGATA